VGAQKPANLPPPSFRSNRRHNGTVSFTSGRPTATKQSCQQNYRKPSKRSSYYMCAVPIRTTLSRPFVYRFTLRDMAAYEMYVVEVPTPTSLSSFGNRYVPRYTCLGYGWPRLVLYSRRNCLWNHAACATGKP
jgi:hypothetical protein